jgi:hypothetical protein
LIREARRLARRSPKDRESSLASGNRRGAGEGGLLDRSREGIFSITGATAARREMLRPLATRHFTRIDFSRINLVPAPLAGRLPAAAHG